MMNIQDFIPRYKQIKSEGFKTMRDTILFGDCRDKDTTHK